MKKLRVPFVKHELEELKIGDKILISGSLLVARDAAHKKMDQSLQEGLTLPVSLKGECIYYMGPSPAKEGEVIGSAGPTTSGRMDPYTPRFLQEGLYATIGKGYRSSEVIEAMLKYKAVYFVCIGGAGALISERIKSYQVLAYEELGAEALARIEVEDFPCIVAIDSQGNNLYTQKHWEK